MQRQPTREWQAAIVRELISQRAFPEAAENLLYGRERPVPIDRQVKPRQHDHDLRELVVKSIPAPVHVRRGFRSGQRRNSLLRYQNAGEDHGSDTGEKTQVEKVVNARAGGCLKAVGW